MAKKRPRSGVGITPGEAEPASKFDAAYWERRLFKNTFTYKGQRQEVRGWSVKIQLLGRRKTFTVSSREKSEAAADAARIYHTLVTHGWDALAGSRGRLLVPAETTFKSSPTRIEFSPEYWRSRLIHRKYPEPSAALKASEFSARMEYAGTSHYFPLGSADEAAAAKQAMRIYQTIVTRGWAEASQKYPRELTLALRWLDDPLAWTYTTIHTVTEFGLPATRAPHRDIAVAIVEPDPGIRFALARAAVSQPGFGCPAVFATPAELMREVARRALDIILVNQSLPEPSPAVDGDGLLRDLPEHVVVFYSVFEDSDHLFKATPGGAMGYMLKRTPPARIFECILGVPQPLRRDEIINSVRSYFQRLSASIPAHAPARELAKLTPREHEILDLLSKGDLAKEIAGKLGISIWTVHGHVKSIFEKLNVHNRTEAVVKFLQK